MTRRPARPGPLLAWMLLLVAATQLRAAAAASGMPGTRGAGRTAGTLTTYFRQHNSPSFVAGMCAVLIRLASASSDKTSLNLREVELFALDGLKITNVVATMSSQYNSASGPSVCTDSQFTDDFRVVRS